MATTKPTIAKAVLSAEERAAKRAETNRRKLARDRVRMLDNVQTCLRQAAAALATDDIERHDQWLSAADDALNAYGKFVRLSTEGDATTPTA